MKTIKMVIVFAFACVAVTVMAGPQPAQVLVVNSSDWDMEVKIMKVDGTLYSKSAIKPHGSITFSVYETGNYYLKTKATKLDCSPLFRKGDAFKVVSEAYGYSKITVTYSIEGGSALSSGEGATISEAEYNR